MDKTGRRRGFAVSPGSLKTACSGCLNTNAGRRLRSQTIMLRPYAVQADGFVVQAETRALLRRQRHHFVKRKLPALVPIRSLGKGIAFALQLGYEIVQKILVGIVYIGVLIVFCFATISGCLTDPKAA